MSGCHDLDVEPLLQVRDLTVRYGGVTAVAGAGFSVGSGEVVGLIGPNGAGKTSCIDAISGFVRSSGGQIVFAGRDIAAVPPHRRVAAGLARTFQASALFVDLTVRENLAVAARPHTRWDPFLDALAPRRRATGHAADGLGEVDGLLDLLGLGDVADTLPGHLPHGRQRLVDIARALATRPSLVLLDEPAAGLDSDETSALSAVVRRLAERGVAALLVDHDMGLVMGSCSRVHVLDLGRVIASGPPDDVRSDPAVVRAYLGDGATP
jgi:branched-chain amino acid transport system ATP-binding protein